MLKFIVDIMYMSLKMVTFPAVLTLLLLLVVFIFYRRQALRYLLAVVIILFFLTGFGITARYLSKPLENHLHPIKNTDILSHHAMIVLGANINAARNTPGLLGYARLLEAARIYRYALRKNVLYTIFLSGGSCSKGKSTEAKIYRHVLLQMGIPKKQIVLENRSKNTFQNAQFVKPLLLQHHIHEALLITSGFHMRRALLYFHHFNMHVVPAPTDFLYPNKLGWSQFEFNLAFARLAINEWYGIAQLYIYNFFGLNNQHHNKGH